MKTFTRQIPLALALTLGNLTAADGPGDTWTPLFNGADLDGWTVKCKPADRASNSGISEFRNSDGTLDAGSRESEPDGD